MPSIESMEANDTAEKPDHAVVDWSKHTTYEPYLMEYSIMAEYRLLQEQEIPGVYVIPSSNSHLVWFGVLFVRGGHYEGGVFKFTLFIPDTYPDCECPRVVFDVPIFHPFIDAVSGELNCRREFHKWRRNVNRIWQLVLYARRVFYRIETKPSPSNPEAAVLLDENAVLFRERVEQSVSLCRHKLYDKPKIEDDHAIRFSELDQPIFNEAKNKILRPQRLTPEPSTRGKGAPQVGLSWMTSGSTSIFSKDESE